MKVIRTDEDIRQIGDPELKSLISSRIEQIAEYVDHFSELVRFVLVGDGDDRAAIEFELGFDVTLRTPDVFEVEGAYIELVYVLGDDGHGVTALVPREAPAASLFRRFVVAGRPT